MAKKKSVISMGKIAIGAGVAAVGAGAYYFLGPKGKQHQRKAKAWMADMETEVEQKLKKAKNFSEPYYHNAVDIIAKTYSEQYKEHAKEVEAFAKKLKSKWKGEVRKVRPVVKKVKRNTR